MHAYIHTYIQTYEKGEYSRRGASPGKARARYASSVHAPPCSAMSRSTWSGTHTPPPEAGPAPPGAASTASVALPSACARVGFSDHLTQNVSKICEISCLQSRFARGNSRKKCQLIPYVPIAKVNSRMDSSTFLYIGNDKDKLTNLCGN